MGHALRIVLQQPQHTPFMAHKCTPADSRVTSGSIINVASDMKVIQTIPAQSQQCTGRLDSRLDGNHACFVAKSRQGNLDDMQSLKLQRRGCQVSDAGCSMNMGGI